MRYYNEQKKERSIRRQARWITVLVFALMVAAMLILTTDDPGQFVPDFMEEWWQEDTTSKEPVERA